MPCPQAVKAVCIPESISEYCGVLLLVFIMALPVPCCLDVHTFIITLILGGQAPSHYSFSSDILGLYILLHINSRISLLSFMENLVIWTGDELTGRFEES